MCKKAGISGKVAKYRWLSSIFCCFGLHRWRYFSGLPRNCFESAPTLRQCKHCKKQQRYEEGDWISTK